MGSLTVDGVGEQRRLPVPVPLPDVRPDRPFGACVDRVVTDAPVDGLPPMVVAGRTRLIVETLRLAQLLVQRVHFVRDVFACAKTR